MKTANRMAQLAAVVAAAMFLCAASALAGDCPELVGVWEDRPAEAVATSGGYAYVWTGDFFSVVDVSDPGAPHAVGELVFPDVVRDIAISGSHAYVLTSEALWVIDVSTPSSPTLVWYNDGFLGTSGVAVSTGYVFVYDSGSDGGPPGSKLVVFDVSTPSLPIQEGYCFTGGTFPMGVAASRQYVYVTSGSPMSVVDTSTPSFPFVVESWYAPFGWGLGVAVDGDFAYVVNGFGLFVIDVGDPTFPDMVGYCDTPGHASDVAVSRGYAYVGERWDGLRVIDVSDPASPWEAGFHRAGWVSDIAVERGYVYVAVRGAGLMIFRECAAVFADGFESGDTSLWSSTVP